MTQPAIQAIIFDFDGTILDTESTQFATVRDEFERLGQTYEMADFFHTIGRADQRHWSEVLQERTGPLDNIGEIRTRRLAAHHQLIAQTPLRDGVVALIDLAERYNKALAVASSSPSSWVEEHLTTRNLIDRFAAVSTRDHVEKAKPWPDVFLHAADRLATDPRACLVIEDSANGVAAAKAAGMTCVAVPNPITRPGDFSDADLVLDSLADLPYQRFGLG
ncbi:MAG: HAD-IA family hydrolase [Actinomycetota bacterium]